jgi:hypothetical protein
VEGALACVVRLGLGACEAELETAMAGAVAKLQGDLFSTYVAAGPNRAEVIARYRQLRAISLRLHDDILKRVSPDALLRQGRRLGLVSGRTWILDDEDELHYALDLAIHTAPPDKARAIDRYARSAKFAPASNEAITLEAMCKARFTLLYVERRHKTAGVIATDLCQRRELWLMDEGLEASVPLEDIIATRLFTPAEFSMTCGVTIPVDAAYLEAALMKLPHLGDKDIAEAANDRRFAEVFYRFALAGGGGFEHTPDLA